MWPSEGLAPAAADYRMMMGCSPGTQSGRSAPGLATDHSAHCDEYETSVADHRSPSWNDYNLTESDFECQVGEVNSN
jgi:hypothetical protein